MPDKFRRVANPPEGFVGSNFESGLWPRTLEESFGTRKKQLLILSFHSKVESDRILNKTSKVNRELPNKSNYQRRSVS